MNLRILSAIASVFAISPQVDGRTFSIPAKSAAPGTQVVFPITLDAANDCASIQIQLNYDVQLLTFVGFELGTGLGSQFTPTSFVENGVITLIWTRDTGLVSGSGSLGQIRFAVNPGAKLSSLTSLTISNFETSDETGVVEFSLIEPFSVVSGSLLVSIGEPDLDDDGIPDTWETTHSLDPESSNFVSDSDHDGRSDFLEYAFGGNQRAADPGRTPATSSTIHSGENYLSLTFYRRQSSSLLFRVMESSTLNSWEEILLPERTVGPPVDHGDGMESVTVRSSFRMKGTGATPKGFMKVEVVKP